MNIDINKIYDDYEDVFLGTIEIADNIVDEYDDADEWAEAMWDKWTSENPEPDVDTEFVDWLCENHGARAVPCNTNVYVG